MGTTSIFGSVQILEGAHQDDEGKYEDDEVM